MIAPAVLILYVLMPPLANWLIGHVGTVCGPGGPCMVPVFPGVLAPSGVLAIGFALVLRDLLQRFLGLPVAIGAVIVGTVLSAAVAPPALVIASGTAFVLSEFADLLVYTPLQRRGLVLAVLASGVVGAVIDSIAFLWLAFGSVDHLAGQVIGKGWAVLFAAAAIWLSRWVLPARAGDAMGVRT